MIRVRRPLDGAGGPSYLPSRGHPHGPTPPPGVPEVGAEVRRRVPTQAPTGRTRLRAQGPKTNQRPAALTAVRALRRRYVGAGSNIKTKACPTSKGRPVRITSKSQRGAARSTTGGAHPANQVPRAVPPHRRGPSLATAKGPPSRRARGWHQGWQSRICRFTSPLTLSNSHCSVVLAITATREDTSKFLLSATGWTSSGWRLSSVLALLGRQSAFRQTGGQSARATLRSIPAGWARICVSWSYLRISSKGRP